MKTTFLSAVALAALLCATDGAWAKKKDAPPPYGQEEYLPPGQAKKHGPPPWAPAHGYRAKQRYRYYPAHNIYQDPVSGLFFSLQGGAWVKGGLPPALAPGGLGKYRVFDGYVDEPWTNNPYSKGGKKK